MASKPTAAEDEVKTSKDAVKELVEQAEALLHSPVAGYDAATDPYDRGVQAVIDLLKSYKD